MCEKARFNKTDTIGGRLGMDEQLKESDLLE
jgi:hypothetical protein